MSKLSQSEAKLEVEGKEVDGAQGFPPNGNEEHISYSPEQIKRLVDAGHISSELGEWFFNHNEEHCKEHEKMQEFIKNNPEVPAEERYKQLLKNGSLSPEETDKFSENAVKSGELFKFLIENKELLKPGALDDLPDKFFKSLQSDEFGMSRLVADPLNKVPQLLKNVTVPELIKEDIYLIKWDCEPNNGDKIRLEYRFRAQDQEDANRLATTFIQRLTGRQKKVFEACWAMANLKMRRTYTCSLTELMETAYPSRKNGAYFSVAEKVEFYQDLLDLSQTQFIVSKQQKKKTKKTQIESFLLPFITIHKFIEEESEKDSDRYPNQISLAVLHNPLYENEAMYNVGAGIKYTTLELHSDDIQLAEWLQVRKNQQMNEKYIVIERSFIISLANLGGIKHSGMANKRLVEKLKRLKEKGIILNCPSKITDPLKLKIR